MRCNEVKRKPTTGTMKLEEPANDNTKSILIPNKPRLTAKSALIHTKKTFAGGASKRSVDHFIYDEVGARIYEKYFDFLDSRGVAVIAPAPATATGTPHPAPRAASRGSSRAGGHPEPGSSRAGGHPEPGAVMIKKCERTYTYISTYLVPVSCRVVSWGPFSCGRRRIGGCGSNRCSEEACRCRSH